MCSRHCLKIENPRRSMLPQTLLKGKHTMKICCQQHKTKFCPECGNPIELPPIYTLRIYIAKHADQGTQSARTKWNDWLNALDALIELGERMQPGNEITNAADEHKQHAHNAHNKKENESCRI